MGNLNSHHSYLVTAVIGVKGQQKLRDMRIKGLIIVGPAPIAPVPFWVPNELDS